MKKQKLIEAYLSKDFVIGLAIGKEEIQIGFIFFIAVLNFEVITRFSAKVRECLK
jgi:hypothetical protein